MEFFHGTHRSFEPGITLEPGHERVFPGGDGDEWVYATNDLVWAYEYATIAAMTLKGNPTVYRVEPTDAEPDPAYPKAHIRARALRIIQDVTESAFLSYSNAANSAAERA